MTISYQLGNSLYLNLTNRCTNNCRFCVRRFKKGVGEYDLWLDKEPTFKEVIESIGDDVKYYEFIFCGYGEPLIKLGLLKKVASYLKENYPEIPIRINTNGQANLIHNKNVLVELESIIDSISISLNAHNAIIYEEICQPQFDESFKHVINFIIEATEYIPNVITSIVTYPGVDVDKCFELAERLGVRLKVREF
ncbi:TatD family nuclease-associated radical SAM protein [Orenia marismortui]|uniref:TatD family-associated radical SAM protein n=1 Tax=Orenia marismortui TaxID=46469 RepID=A0A4R8GY29_9FIRM|nr:TatD family nuclease-associated radical SAM protein [Orenia marismortui]TDX51295.1 TatD family-associated radical SAM protein [Orenia marismortui]